LKDSKERSNIYHDKMLRGVSGKPQQLIVATETHRSLFYNVRFVF